MQLQLAKHCWRWCEPASVHLTPSRSTHRRPPMGLMSTAGKGAAALQVTLLTLFFLCIVEMSSAATLKKCNLLEMWGNPPL